MGWDLPAVYRDTLLAPGLIQREAGRLRAALKVYGNVVDALGWLRKFCPPRCTAPIYVVRSAFATVDPASRLLVCFERDTMLAARSMVRASRAKASTNPKVVAKKLSAYLASCCTPDVDCLLDDDDRARVASAKAWLDGELDAIDDDVVPECNRLRRQLQSVVDPKIAARIDAIEVVLHLPITWQEAFDRPLVKPAVVRALFRAIQRWTIEGKMDGSVANQVVVVPPGSGRPWVWPFIPPPPTLPTPHAAPAGSPKRRRLAVADMLRAEVTELEEESFAATWEIMIGRVRAREHAGYGEGEMIAIDALRAAAASTASDEARAARKVRTSAGPVGAAAGSLRVCYKSGDTDFIVQMLGAGILNRLRVFIHYANVSVADGKTFRASGRAPPKAKKVCEAVDLAPCFGPDCVSRPQHLALACALTAKLDYSPGLGAFGFLKQEMVNRMLDPDAPTMVTLGDPIDDGVVLVVCADSVRRFLKGVKKRKRRAETDVAGFLDALRRCLFSAAYFSHVYANRANAGPDMADIPEFESNDASTVTQWLEAPQQETMYIG